MISFPHVEGETTPDSPAKGILEVFPDAIHSQTRLAAEKYLFEACRNSDMQPVVFRAGTIYGRGLKLIEATRWLMGKGLLAVWRKPTWVHLLSLPDFLRILQIGLEREDLSGIYNLCDDEPVLLQDFFLQVSAIRTTSKDSLSCNIRIDQEQKNAGLEFRLFCRRDAGATSVFDQLGRTPCAPT